MGLLCVLGIVFFSTTSFGQTAGFQSEVGDLKGHQWKTGAALTSAIVEEKAWAETAKLASAAHPTDVALLSFYQAYLDRIDVHVQNNLPTEDALVKAFDETVIYARDNASLNTVVPETVFPLVHQLVERLHEVPQAAPVTD